MVLGEERLSEVDLAALGVFAGWPRLILGVAVEAVDCGARTGGERGCVHHRERRVDRMVMAEIDAALVAQARELRGQRRVDGIGTQAVPNEQNHVALVRIRRDRWFWFGRGGGRRARRSRRRRRGLCRRLGTAGDERKTDHPSMTSAQADVGHD